MRKLLTVMAGAIIALSIVGVAWAENAPASPSEYTADEIAENQGAVAYWYAWGYNYAFGHFPASFAEMKEHGLPLRGFFSPHTGDVINFDDGALDFDGDMTYAVTSGSPEIHIQTTKGVVNLPGTLTRTDECGKEFCTEILICKAACWDVCDDHHAACKILEWMMWKSFETHESRYGYRPVDEKAWMASGFSPIESDWRDRYPYMVIKLVYGKCELKKAHVKCCEPCPKCEPCAVVKPCETKCDTCKPVSKPACNTCKQVSKPVCETKCNTCKPVSKPACNTCKQVSKPVCETKCNTCQPVAKPKCNTCQPVAKPKCNTCQPVSKPTCNTCKPVSKPKCDSCNKCKPKCENKCGKCAIKSASNCVTCVDSVTSMAAPASPQACACDAWVPYSGSEMVKSLSISITASEGTSDPLKLLLRNPAHQQLALIELPGLVDGNYKYTYTFETPVKASDLLEAELINDGNDPATLTSFRVVGMDGAYFSYVYADHTCPGAVIGPGGCDRMQIS